MIIIKENEAMNLRGSKGWIWNGIRGGKGRGKIT